MLIFAIMFTVWSHHCLVASFFCCCFFFVLITESRIIVSVDPKFSLFVKNSNHSTDYIAFIPTIESYA